MSASGFVDWGLAERVALALGGNDGAPGVFDQEAVDSACAEAMALALDYSRLRPQASCRSPSWSIARSGRASGCGRCASSRSSSSAGSPTASRSRARSGGLARSLAGAAAGAEAGVAVGYGARKVLGQYDVPLVPTERQPRLVFVGPNLAAAHLELGEDPDLFLRWIALHESTHSIQFASVPWLRPHLAELLEQLIDGASARLDLGSLGELARRLFRSDPRAAVRRVLRGDLARLLAGPSRGAPSIASRRRCR